MYQLKMPYEYKIESAVMEDRDAEGGYRFETQHVRKAYTVKDLSVEETNYIDSFMNHYWTRYANGHHTGELYEYVWDQIQHLEYEIHNIPRSVTNSEYFKMLPEKHMNYQIILWFIFIESQKIKDKNELLLLAHHMLNIHIDQRQTREKEIHFIVELFRFLYSVNDTNRVLDFILKLFKKEMRNHNYDEDFLKKYQTETLQPFYDFLHSNIFMTEIERVNFLVSLQRIMLLECNFLITAQKIEEIISTIDHDIVHKLREKQIVAHQKQLNDSHVWNDGRSH